MLLALIWLSSDAETSEYSDDKPSLERPGPSAPQQVCASF